MEENEFSTSFSTNFFTDFSSEFSGFKPTDYTFQEDYIFKSPDLNSMQSVSNEIDNETDNKTYDFKKSSKIELDCRMPSEIAEEKAIIKKHKEKYKEYIDEYLAQKKSAVIEPISLYHRVDRAIDLLHSPITSETKQIANEIGCVIKNQTLYPVNWCKEEIDELNRRLRNG